MELHVFVQLWNRISAPKLSEANTIPAIENGECCVREHTLLIRCRCSVCYCHRKLLPFDSSTYISEGKTSKRQRRKYMIPNRRPSFTSNVSIGYSMWPFCFCESVAACSSLQPIQHGWLGSQQKTFNPIYRWKDISIDRMEQSRIEYISCSCENSPRILYDISIFCFIIYSFECLLAAWE